MSPSTADGSAHLTTGVHRRAPDGSHPPHPLLPSPRRLAEADSIVRRTEAPTPLVWSPALSKRYGREVWLKLESLSPIRSFKHRGALVALDKLESAVVTASTGNHGQGVAYAAGRRGIPATVVVPTNALESKVEAIRSLGARVIVAGANLSEAQRSAEAIAAETGSRYLEDGEDPALMAGAAGVMIEIAEQLQAPLTVLVPVGGGNLIAGALLAADLTPGTTIIGVQSAAAPAVTASWLAGRLVERPCTTFAGGLATERPGQLSLNVLIRRLTTLGLVTEADLYAAVVLGVRLTGVLLEGAGAAPLALLDRHHDQIPGERVVLVASGSWISTGQLEEALSRGASP